MQIAVGPFLKDLKVQLENDNEFIVFSAHQETLGPLLAIIT